MPTNLILTGASGFIGRHIRDFFSNDGTFVIWSASRSDPQSSIREIVKNNNLENVFVLLNGWGGVHSTSKLDSRLQSESLETFKNQVAESIYLKPAGIIGFGSQAEYAEGEDEKRADPQHLTYALAKKNAREFLLRESNVAQVSSHWLRLFSIYGPGMDERWILPNMIRHAEKNKTLSVGACKQLWGFLHVRDFCKALRLIIDNSMSVGFDIDVGYPAEKPLRETLLDVEKILNRKVLHFVNDNFGQIDSVPNLGDLYQLGWQPEVSLEFGVKELVQHYARN